MTHPYIDTDVIVRLLTGDDPTKQAEALELFEQVERGDLSLAAPDTVIADAVFVLSSKRLYNKARDEVASLLLALVRLPGFHVENRSVVLDALYVYATTPVLDFGDAMIVASMRRTGSDLVYSYDRHFDAVEGIIRRPV